MYLSVIVGLLIGFIIETSGEKNEKSHPTQKENLRNRVSDRA
jgi:hypothetical protein